MIDCIYHRTRTDGTELCETFSTENFRLKQEETGRIYGSSVVDVIAGYDDSGKPFSRYHYTETDEKDESEEATAEEYDEALSELGVGVNDEA